MYIGSSAEVVALGTRTLDRVASAQYPTTAMTDELPIHAKGEMAAVAQAACWARFARTVVAGRVRRAKVKRLLPYSAAGRPARRCGVTSG